MFTVFSSTVFGPMLDLLYGEATVEPILEHLPREAESVRGLSELHFHAINDDQLNAVISHSITWHFFYLSYRQALIFHQMLKPAAWNVQSSSALREGYPLPSQGNPVRLPCLSTVLYFCRPLTICWFVVAIVFDAVNFMSRRRARPHVLVEEPEVLSPAFANLNPAATIVLKLLVLRVFTSLYHHAPDAILWRVAQPVKVRPFPSCCHAAKIA